MCSAQSTTAQPTPATARSFYVERVLNPAPSWLGWAGQRAAAPYLAEGGSWREFERCVGEMVELLPGSSKVFDFYAYNRGVWLFEDEVQDQMQSGARALFKVAQTLTKICEVRFYAKC